MINTDDLIRFLNKNLIFTGVPDSVLKSFFFDQKNHISVKMKGQLFHWQLDIIYQQKNYHVFTCKTQDLVMQLIH